MYEHSQAGIKEYCKFHDVQTNVEIIHNNKTWKTEKQFIKYVSLMLLYAIATYS